ncbi:MAG: response regulator [Deltaproteobacteria bacterium]|nr:response regulator [Deltaproteobacteria bacterium]
MDKSRILVVDDESLIQYALGHALRSDGFEVNTVGSAEEALSELQSERYELCFLDRGLPGLDGLQALQHVKAAWPGIKVIFMTGGRLTADEEKLIEQWADQFIEKPFDLQKIKTMVEEMIREKGLGT